MRFAGAIVAMLAGLVAAETRAQLAASDEAPYGRDCTAFVQGIWGQISITINVDEGGRGGPYQLRWQSPLRSQGVRLAINWVSHRLDPPQDSDAVQVHFVTGRRGNRMRRLEIARELRIAYGGDLSYTSQFSRGSGEIFGGARLGDLRALMQGVAALNVMAIEQRRGMVATDRIEAAWLDWPAAAAEAARPEMEGGRADFRSRCPIHEYSPGEDI